MSPGFAVMMTMHFDTPALHNIVVVLLLIPQRCPHSAEIPTPEVDKMISARKIHGVQKGHSGDIHWFFEQLGVLVCPRNDFYNLILE